MPGLPGGFFIVFYPTLPGCHSHPLFNPFAAQIHRYYPQRILLDLGTVIELQLRNPAYHLIWNPRLSGSQLLAGVAWRVTCRAKRRSPFNWYVPLDCSVTGVDLETKVDPFQPPHYSNNPPWQAMGAACSRSSTNCLSWYASQTESDGPQTSDLSPVSGYFDWSHSSNNTSPIQYDELVYQPSPRAAHQTSRIVQPDGQSSFVTDYSDLRRPSYYDTQRTLRCQDHQNSGADLPEPERALLDDEKDATTVQPSSISTLSEDKNWSEPMAKDVAEHEDCASSRSGKRWKAAHRAVERRYRSNLNLKIIKLGQCVPAIRDQAVALEDLENGEDDRPAPRAKLQKGHVLSKAVDYIQFLQRRVSELEAENKHLEGRFQALHMVEEEGDEISLGTSDRRRSPEIARRHSEQLFNLSASRRTNSLSTGLTDATNDTGSSLLETQNRLSLPQNEFSFVSENPSLTSKRPRVPRGEVVRMLSA